LADVPSWKYSVIAPYNLKI